MMEEQLDVQQLDLHAIAERGCGAPNQHDASARDPLTYTSVGALIVLVAILASAVPAVRATRADPNTALRSD